MPGNITTTQIDDALATIIAAQSLGYLKANTVLARLVARDWNGGEFATKGQAIKIPFRGSLTAQDKSEGSVVTLQQAADTSVTLTLNKHKEISFLFEDFARALADPRYLQGYLEDAMKVLGEQMDSDIAGLYSGLSQTIDASAGLTAANFRNARRLLNAAKSPLADRYAVLNEDADYEFLGLDESTNAAYRQAFGGALADAFGGRFMGFGVYMDQKIVTATTVKNLFFHKNAFALATRALPPAPQGVPVFQKTMDEDGIGLRVTLSYNASYLGVQCTVDVLYGVVELRDAFGVTVSTTDM